MPHVEQDLLTLLEHLRLPLVFGGVRVGYLVFYVVSCALLFICLSSFIFSQALSQFIFDLWVWLSLWYLSSLFFKNRKVFDNLYRVTIINDTFLPSVCFCLYDIHDIYINWHLDSKYTFLNTRSSNTVQFSKKNNMQMEILTET